MECLLLLLVKSMLLLLLSLVLVPIKLLSQVGLAACISSEFCYTC